jgi:hypothetical protein
MVTALAPQRAVNCSVSISSRLDLARQHLGLPCVLRR